MKITIEIENILINEIKQDIQGYFYEALNEAHKKAEKDIDKISRKTLLKVKDAIKLLKIK